MARMRQIRDVIAVRRREEWRAATHEKEIIVRYLASAVFGAAGHARAAKQANRFRMTPKEKAEAVSTEAALRRFPVDNALGGLITQEEIDARVAQMKAEGLA